MTEDGARIIHLLPGRKDCAVHQHRSTPTTPSGWGTESASTLIPNIVPANSGVTFLCIRHDQRH
jgi:hypothetical protein